VFTEPGTARQEAERLVAAALAFASLAANSHPELATGSAACCVCPFCRLIEAVRDPDPQVVERLATGAGDLAVGVAGLLRSLSGMAKPSPDPWRTASDSAAPSHDGTAPATGRTAPSARSGSHGATPAGTDATFAAAQTADSPARPRKAVAKKALATKPVPKNVPDNGTGWPAADSQPSAQADDSGRKPPAKRAGAEKTIKKAMPKPRPNTSG
jgi:hypothetical protein